MNTLIRAAEVWLPSPDGTLLEFGGGWFENAPTFGAMSRALCFGRAEGLPGHAWHEARPILLKGFEGSYFQRTAAAHAAGLRSAVALPMFVAERLTSVVVLFCGEDGAGTGAIELWRNDPRVTTDLSLADGRFGGSQELESLTRDAYLPAGSGLPGLAWQRRSTVYIDDIESDARFLRTQAAAAAGLVRGLAIPCATLTRVTWILSLLAAAHMPVARRVESWIAGIGAGEFVRGFGFCEAAGNLAADSTTIISTATPGPIAATFASGVAGIVRLADAPREPPIVAAEKAGHGWLLTLPIAGDAGADEVLALYF